MKPKNFALRFLVTVIVGFLVWWFLRPIPKVPEKTADVSAVSKIDLPKQIAQPLSAPAKSKSETGNTPSVSTDSTPDAIDPQTDLKTTIPDIARLYRDHDITEFYQTYTPPEKIDPQEVQRIHESELSFKANIGRNPGADQTYQMVNYAVVRAWEALADQTPIYNDAGDEATYTRTIDNGLTEPISGPVTFIKINGKWYLKDFQ